MRSITQRHHFGKACPELPNPQLLRSSIPLLSSAATIPPCGVCRRRTGSVERSRRARRGLTRHCQWSLSLSPPHYRPRLRLSAQCKRGARVQ